jgi:hypothetical protein
MAHLVLKGFFFLETWKKFFKTVAESGWTDQEAQSRASPTGAVK